EPPGRPTPYDRELPPTDTRLLASSRLARVTRNFGAFRTQVFVSSYFEYANAAIARAFRPETTTKRPMPGLALHFPASSVGFRPKKSTECSVRPDLPHRTRHYSAGRGGAASRSPPDVTEQTRTPDKTVLPRLIHCLGHSGSYRSGCRWQSRHLC